MDVVLPYVRERKQFGQAIGEFQLVQGASRRHVYPSRQQPGAGLFGGERLRSGPHQPQGLCRRHPVCRRERHPDGPDAIQLLGGNGYINEYPTGRLLRDAKLYEIGARHLGDPPLAHRPRAGWGRAHEQDPLPSRHREPRL